MLAACVVAIGSAAARELELELEEDDAVVVTDSVALNDARYDWDGM
jgi:hypothetical protein